MSRFNGLKYDSSLIDEIKDGFVENMKIYFIHRLFWCL